MNKGFTFKAIFIIPIIILLGVMIRFSQVGEGVHTGYITAVDQRGYIFRNYDAYFKTDNQSSQEDLYCIDRNDKELIKKAQLISQNRKLVSIQYKGVRGIGLGLCKHPQILNILDYSEVK